jgi:hypothetical protein
MPADRQKDKITLTSVPGLPPVAAFLLVLCENEIMIMTNDATKTGKWTAYDTT